MGPDGNVRDGPSANADGVPSANENAGMVDAFQTMTNASRQEALSYLRTHNFDLDAAFQAFMAHNAPRRSPSPPPPPPSQRRRVRRPPTPHPAATAGPAPLDTNSNSDSEPERDDQTSVTENEGIGSSSSEAAGAPIQTTDAAPNTAPLSSFDLVVDQSLPVTTIHVQFADGTSLFYGFNYHHTIRDLRAFIDVWGRSRERIYQLETMDSPPRQLTDLDQTIEEAGIANSTVVQKF